MVAAFVSFILAAMGAVSTPRDASACVDAIAITATKSDATALRELLQKGSLTTLRSESCRDYRVTLTRNRDQGWTISMSSRTSSRKFERKVTRLTYAATWVEAWTQSGFASTEEDVTAAPPPAPPPPEASPVAATPIAALPPTRSDVFVGILPLAAVTNRKYGLWGVSAEAGYPFARTPWLGGELGILTHPGAEGSDYRRAYWAGIMAGASLRLSGVLRVRPGVSFGVHGTALRAGSVTANATNFYAGLSGGIEYTLMPQLAVSVGLGARLLFGNDSASATVTTSKIDDGELETETSTAVVPGIGRFRGELRLGLLWHFGSSS